MCNSILWIGKKVWIIVGVLLYFFDIGSDIALMIDLLLNCHYKYAAASICILLLAFIISWLKGYNGQRDCCFMGRHLYFKWKIFFHGEDAIDDYQKRVMDRTKVYEAMLESLPQIGLSFYIMNHHGLDDPVVTNIKGDIQIFSLIASILSVFLSFSINHAWRDFNPGDGCPKMKDNVKAALWNFVPLACFLVGFFIIMGNYFMLFLYIGMLMLQVVVVFISNLKCNCKCLNYYSMNRFLVFNTLIVAILFTIQLLIFGVEENPNLFVRPFNNCLNTSVLPEFENKLNVVFSYSIEFFIAIWTIVFLGMIHTIAECFYPPKEGFVNFWTFMFSKLNI